MTEREIFSAALDKPTAQERSNYLNEACGADTALRQRLEELLQMHEQTGEFLHTPLVDCLAQKMDLQDSGDENSRGTTRRVKGINLGFLDPSDEPGSLGKIGHYEVREVIGAGGMGIVLRAFDARLHRMVAIKVMAAPLAACAVARKRFQREARAAAAVCHDHIVTIHAVEESGDLPYIVMQLVAGQSLQQRIDRSGPLSLHEILRIGIQTAAGLAVAHAQGLVHLDIKPANILLENGIERVRITDFGLARAASDASTSQTDVVAGTPQYMAPEQARGEALDHRADLFSLGSVLYAMCTGRAPFRAATSMAVLKRVCDDAPSPIREANPDIPEWLTALIDKLQAKSPDDRYQSAAEVADLLSQRLAQLQRPGAPSPVRSDTSGQSAESRNRRARWLIAATAALVLLTCSLAFTEAQGLTKLTTTVVRILTPDGALIVETADSAVQVTVEGDGGLIITGAGLEQIRLRPGSYRVRADKDGQPVPLDRQLVTVSRGDVAIVRVNLESPQARAEAKPEQRAFVLLGGKRVAERKFDTLAEAVLTSTNGDTIEIRGNGPFLMPPILIQQSLTIRAGKGFLPVIRLNPGAPRDDYLIESHGSLVLEGLEIREASKRRTQPALVGRSIIFSRGASIHLANCRVFQDEPIHEDVGLVFAETDHPTDREAHPNVTLRNCQFRLRNGQVAGFGNEGPAHLLMENSVCLGGFVTYLNHSHAGNEAVQEYRRNTIVANIFAMVGFSAAPDAPRGDSKEKRLRFEASHNVIDLKWAMMDFQFLDTAKINAQQAIDAEAVLMPLMEWRERRNLFSASATAIHWAPGLHDSRILAPAGLQGWLRRWNQTESESFEGMPRFHGGNLLAKAATSPEKITAEDFRLRPDSAGYHGGDDGKDLGADVDLVGPGAAYERWRKTPEYQQWLKESGQQE